MSLQSALAYIISLAYSLAPVHPGESIINPTQSLYEASKKGDLARMRACLEAGADPIYWDGQDFPRPGKSTLSQAIDSGSIEAVKLLLDAGANVEIYSEIPYDLNLLDNPTSRGASQLGYAIAVGSSTEIIKLLVSYSKNLDKADLFTGHWTPYRIARFYERDDIATLLAEAGATVAD